MRDMKKFSLKNINGRKFFGTIIGGLIFLCCILFFTYAYYVWGSADTTINLGIVDISTECILGSNVNVSNIGPVLDYNDGVKANFSITGESTEAVPLTLEITSIDDELRVDYFKYMLVYDAEGGTNYVYDNVLASGDFSEMVVGSNLIVDNLVTSRENTYSYKFVVYIDGTIYNDLDIQNYSLDSSLMIGNCNVG